MIMRHCFEFPTSTSNFEKVSDELVYQNSIFPLLPVHITPEQQQLRSLDLIATYILVLICLVIL